MWPCFCKHDFLKNGIRSRFSKYKRMVCSISLINWFWAEAKWTHLYLVKHNCEFIHRHWRELEILNRTQIFSCCPIVFGVTESFSLSLLFLPPFPFSSSSLVLFKGYHAHPAQAKRTWERATTKWPQWQIPFRETIASQSILHLATLVLEMIQGKRNSSVARSSHFSHCYDQIAVKKQLRSLGRWFRQ